MATPSNFDPSQKFQQAAQPADQQAGLKPAILLLIVCSILAWFTVRDFRWMFDASENFGNPLIHRVLPLHPYWIQLFLCLAAAISLLRKDSVGFVLGSVSIVFGLGMRVFFLFYISAKYPSSLLENARRLLGLSYPPDGFSLLNLALGILYVSTLIVLNLDQVKNGLKVSAAQQRSAVVFGFVFLVYGLICYFMVDVLDSLPSTPAPEF